MAAPPCGGPFALRVTCPAGLDAGRLADLLLEMGAEAVDQPAPREAARPSHGRGRSQPSAGGGGVVVTARFPADAVQSPGDLVDALVAAMEADSGALQYEVAAVDLAEEQTDWVKHVQQFWPPLPVTSTVAVRFPWHAEAEVRRVCGDRARVLTLEGGEAFGCGEHATTLLCARWLEAKMRAVPNGGQGCAVLDYGCGAGLLALVAKAAAPASRVAALDADPVALASAQRNAATNGLALDFFRPGPGVPGAEVWTARQSLCAGGPPVVPALPLQPCGAFQVVVANMLSTTLIAVEPVLADMTCDGASNRKGATAKLYCNCAFEHNLLGAFIEIEMWQNFEVFFHSFANVSFQQSVFGTAFISFFVVKSSLGCGSLLVMLGIYADFFF
eukprot:EG_transcript_8601